MSFDLAELGLEYVDGGPPPEGLLEAVELHRAANPRLIKPTTTAEADAFFANLAEEVKRARGGP